MRAAYTIRDGKRVLVGYCTCTATLLCGLCMQLLLDPPESKEGRAARLREERARAKADRKARWSERQRRYARKLEGREND